MVLLSPNFCGAMGMEGGGGGKVGGKGGGEGGGEGLGGGGEEGGEGLGGGLGGGGRLGVQQVSRLDTGRTGGGGEV